jgi:peptidoglycan/xylan/chitin deacetylase (PgdA/CDA1 family)
MARREAFSTGTLLDHLNSHRPSNSTFFVVGNMVKLHQEMYKREIAEGHSIGSHTMSHPDLSQVSPAQLELEIASTEALLASLHCIRPKVFRPPFGRLNNVQLGIVFVRALFSTCLCCCLTVGSRVCVQ